MTIRTDDLFEVKDDIFIPAKQTFTKWASCRWLWHSLLKVSIFLDMALLFFRHSEVPFLTDNVQHITHMKASDETIDVLKA